MIGASAQNASGTTTNTQTTTPERGGLPLTGTLRLRGEADEQSSEPPEQDRHIKWAEDVVDNEGQGRKSSKVCCIYHKPRPAGESSSESESSDSDLDDDSDDDAGGGRSDKAHSYKGSGCSDHQKRKPRPNAYERVPKNKK
ncbi:type 1 phosphatase regulator ypi1 [Trichophyton violaceum]|uniref:Type 1 phosphatases regulator n=1 Tax=Trichophyton violaceum TaxID=34388 RepID=A0A178FHF8_TRIVO|nr:type 1 phosphatase regulator ypi1 [Trichophyton violaceum]